MIISAPTHRRRIDLLDLASPIYRYRHIPYSDIITEADAVAYGYTDTSIDVEFPDDLILQKVDEELLARHHKNS